MVKWFFFGGCTPFQTHRPISNSTYLDQSKPTIHYWLVVWNMFYFSIQLGSSCSQLTFIFFRGPGIPPTRLLCNTSHTWRNEHLLCQHRHSDVGCWLSWLYIPWISLSYLMKNIRILLFCHIAFVYHEYLINIPSKFNWYLISYIILYPHALHVWYIYLHFGEFLR